MDVNGKMYKFFDYCGKIVVLEWVNLECLFVVKYYEGSGNIFLF